MANDDTEFSGIEQRVEPRWLLKSSVSVFTRQTKECLGLMMNCSENGLMISTYQPLDQDQKLDIDIVDIHPDMDGRRTGHCSIQIMWSKSLNPSMFAAGCRIIERSPEFDTMLRDYIQAHSDVDAHPTDQAIH